MEISSFYTYVPKITVIWCMVFEIWSPTDRTFCHFGPFFALLPPSPSPIHPLMIPKIKILKKLKKMPGDIILLHINVYHKWRSYDIWFLKYKVQQTEIFVILRHFCHFRLLTTWKIKILTLKKTPGDITILHICTINDNRMVFGSWDMEHHRHDFFCHSGPFFALLPHYGPRKSKFWKNEKKTPEDIIIL